MSMTAFERNAIVQSNRRDVEALLVKIRHGFATHYMSNIRFSPKVKYVSEKGSVTCVIQIGTQIEFWIDTNSSHLRGRIEKCGKIFQRNVTSVEDLVDAVMDEYVPYGKRHSPITLWTTNDMRKAVEAGMITPKAMKKLCTKYTNIKLREIERAEAQCLARIEKASNSKVVSK